MVTPHPSRSRSRSQAAPGYASRLWAGGVATAVVSALVAVAGAAVSQAVFDVPLLSPAEQGVLGWSTTASYGAGAAVLALFLTGVLHLLVAAVLRPVQYFRWIVALAGVVLVVAPFAYEAPRSSQVATSVVSALVIAAIGSLLGSQAALVVRRGPGREGR